MSKAPSDPRECPLCGDGFADRGSVENHILNKTDEKHQSAGDYDLNQIDQVRDWYRRKAGEEGGDPVLDGGPPTPPAGEEDEDRSGEPGVTIRCPKCGGSPGHVVDAPEGVPEDFMCVECSSRIEGDRAFCFSMEDIEA